MRRLLLLFIAAASLPPVTRAAVSIEIDLTQQKAHLLFDGEVLYSSPISSGRQGYPTPTGTFQVIEKDLNHYSSLYGRVVDADGRTVVREADSDTPLPRGGKFVPAPMKYFIRFDGATGMHAGPLPGRPASHGCVRMPAPKAKLFFDSVSVGDTVRVHGRAPVVFEPRPTAIPQPSPGATPRKPGFFERLRNPAKARAAKQRAESAPTPRQAR